MLAYIATSALALGSSFDFIAYKNAHPERFQHEYTPEEIAEYRVQHPERFGEHHHQYSPAEMAAYKAEHPERFEGRSHQYSVAQIAAYKAQHPERFVHFDEEDCKSFAHFEQNISEDNAPATHQAHNYSAAQLIIFSAGMAHAKQVADYKQAHPEMASKYSPEAIAEYKKAHPERIAAAKAIEAYTKDELDVFKAGFEHYSKVVAPYMVEHPDAFTAHSIAEYIFAHPERLGFQKV